MWRGENAQQHIYYNNNIYYYEKLIILAIYLAQRVETTIIKGIFTEETYSYLYTGIFFVEIMEVASCIFHVLNAEGGLYMEKFFINESRWLDFPTLV